MVAFYLLTMIADETDVYLDSEEEEALEWNGFTYSWRSPQKKRKGPTV